MPQRGLQLTNGNTPGYLTGQGPVRPHRVAQGLQGGKKGCPGASSIDDTINQGSASDPTGAGRGQRSVRRTRQRGPAQHSGIGAHQMVATWDRGPRVAQLSDFS